MLFKRKNSQYWWYRFTSPDGTTVRQSAKTADKKKAQELAKESDDKFKFIIFSDDSELPYLIRGGYYSNVARMRWNVNEEDKAFLTQRVRIAIDKLCTDTTISV